MSVKLASFLSVGYIITYADISYALYEIVEKHEYRKARFSTPIQEYKKILIKLTVYQILA